MSSLTFQLTKFDSDDIEKKASLKPKKLSKRRTKKQSFLTRNSYFIIKCIIISITLFLFFHNIKLKLSAINNLKQFNKTTKQKLTLLQDSISQLTININALSKESSKLEEQRQMIKQKQTEIEDNYKGISSKINDLETQKKSLNKDLSQLVSQYQSLQIQVNTQREYYNHGSRYTDDHYNYNYSDQYIPEWGIDPYDPHNTHNIYGIMDDPYTYHTGRKYNQYNRYSDDYHSYSDNPYYPHGNYHDYNGYHDYVEEIPYNGNRYSSYHESHSGSHYPDFEHQYNHDFSNYNGFSDHPDHFY